MGRQPTRHLLAVYARADIYCGRSSSHSGLGVDQVNPTDTGPQSCQHAFDASPLLKETKKEGLFTGIQIECGAGPDTCGGKSLKGWPVLLLSMFLTCLKALIRLLVEQDRLREFASTGGVLECRRYMNSTITIETALKSKDTASCRR